VYVHDRQVVVVGTDGDGDVEREYIDLVDIDGIVIRSLCDEVIEVHIGHVVVLQHGFHASLFVVLFNYNDTCQSHTRYILIVLRTIVCLGIEIALELHDGIECIAIELQK
jgi:hypothetical protein